MSLYSQEKVRSGNWKKKSSASATVPASSKTEATSYLEQNLCLFREIKKKFKRVEKQPLEYPSAGSAFKRPEGYFAGKLVMDAGLSGYAVGGAKVSEKHCGFLINAGGATASDVMELIRQIQAKVKEQFGVQLEPEIQFLGEF